MSGDNSFARTALRSSRSRPIAVADTKGWVGQAFRGWFARALRDTPRPGHLLPAPRRRDSGGRNGHRHAACVPLGTHRAKERKGPDAREYALIISLIAIVAVVALKFLGGKITTIAISEMMSA